METIRKSATVKVMLSHNYNHFEASILIENEEGISLNEINETRKDCNRICDRAIEQYKKSKSMAALEIGHGDVDELRKEVERIKKRKDGVLLPSEKAKIKALEDHDFARQWDYEDDPF